MSFAPKTLLALRAYLKTETGLADNELGIVGDTAHRYGYHLGEDRLPTGDYSARTARDIAGLSDAASATDVGMFPRLPALTAYLVALGRAGELPDVRELIGPGADGRAYRWDSLSGWKPQPRDVGDPHEWHLHISWYRDSEGRDKTAAFRAFFDGQGELMSEQELNQLLDKIHAVTVPGGTSMGRQVDWYGSKANGLAPKLDHIMAQLDDLKSKVDTVTLAGVDLDAFAGKVADLLAQRLQS